MIQRFVDDCLQAPSFEQQRRVLTELVRRPALHARFLNTLARLEYVGVRKMLKARQADSLTLEGLQHILEEAVHAVRLKKLALALAPRGVTVATFSEVDTLEGDAAERYFQAIDRAAESHLLGAPETCYWLTSTAIEIRAQSFYPAYQALLESGDCPVSVASIVSDETRHLETMARELPPRLPDWAATLSAVMAVEEREFRRYLDRVESRLGATSGPVIET